jgi:23S rRNA pseudouridine2605 synthase
MLEAVGHPVTRLHRSHYAGLSADDLEPGAWRELSAAEVQHLRDNPFRTLSPHAPRG